MLLVTLFVLYFSIFTSWCQTVKQRRFESVEAVTFAHFLPCLNVCPRRPLEYDGQTNCTKLTGTTCISTIIAGKKQPFRFSAPSKVMLAEEKYHITLTWKQSTCILCNNESTINYTPAYRIEIRNESEWFPLAMTCASSWSTNWTEDCSSIQLRVAALGQCAERRSSYSEIVPMSGLRFPPAMTNVSLSRIANQKADRFFDIRIKWSFVWSKWSLPLSGTPKLVVKQWDCPTEPGKFPYQTTLSKLNYDNFKTLAIATLKVHTSSIGCRFTFQMVACSKCKTTSDVLFKMDLVECNLVPDSLQHHCIVPPVDSSTIEVSYIGLTTKDNGQISTNLFRVTWEAATTSLSDRVIYQLAWQTAHLNASAIVAGDISSIYRAIVFRHVGNKTVPGNWSCALIECDSCLSKRLYLQVAVANAVTGYSGLDWGNARQWPCFDTSFGFMLNQPATLYYKSTCPDFDAHNTSSVELLAPVNLQRCERVSRPPPVTTTTTSSTHLTSKDDFTTTSSSQSSETEAPNSRATVDVPITGGALGAEIWAPFSVATLICVAAVVFLFVYIYRSRKRDKPSKLTVDKLREVISEVSMKPSNQTALQCQPSGASNGSAAVASQLQSALQLSPTNSLSSGDNWEITSNALMFTELLGEGAFGKVMKATLTNNNNDDNDIVVAVKMVPDNAEATLLEDFLNEIVISKRMGRHPCLLNMIACITQSQPVCLVVEYAENGDLLSFLQKQSTILCSDGVTLRDLNYIDLLTFAKQVALGMEFISVRGFIHRDLACRNVMVDGKRNAKIGDFGLARFAYDNSVYFTRIGRALPIRWMPPEALYERKFSTASDVWSFGILLYELVTLGGSPYPGITTQTLVRELRNGYHMEQSLTRNCPDNMYALMENCWTLRPEDRPSFSTLVKECSKLLAAWASSSTEYVDISEAALFVYALSAKNNSDNNDNDEADFASHFTSDSDISMPNFI